MESIQPSRYQDVCLEKTLLNVTCVFQVMLDTQHEESRAELERIEHQRKLKQLQKQEKKIHHWLFDSVGK